MCVWESLSAFFGFVLFLFGFGFDGKKCIITLPFDTRDPLFRKMKSREEIYFFSTFCSVFLACVVLVCFVVVAVDMKNLVYILIDLFINTCLSIWFNKCPLLPFNEMFYRISPLDYFLWWWWWCHRFCRNFVR